MAKTDLIVTNNIRDFDTRVLTSWNIKAQLPDDFLCDLFDDYPEEMVQVVRKQSQKYRRRPLTFTELLSLLSKIDGANLPKFVGKIRYLEFGDNVV